MRLAATNARAHVARVAALAVAILSLGQGAAHAGTIGFRTDAEVTAGPGVDLKVTLSNTGDESAEEVSVRAQLLDRTVDGETVASVFAGHEKVWNFHLFDEIPRGVYVIVLTTRYNDTNGYPFEVVSTAIATVDAAPVLRIQGSLDVGRVPVDGEARAHLTAKRPASRSGNVEVRLVAPSGLQLIPDVLSIHFDTAGKASADFRVRNLKLLAGTSINIFAFLTANDPGFPQTDPIRGSVNIGQPVVRMTQGLFYKSAAAMFVLLVFLEGLSWLRTRRGDRE